MSKPREPKPAKLVIGLFMKEKELFEPLVDKLVSRFGAPDLVSRWMSFDYTAYYEQEMGSPLFRRLQPWQIRQVVLIGQVRTYAVGESIVQAGNTCLYVILDGVVDVTEGQARPHPGRQTSLEAGALFNESALLGTAEKLSRARAQTPARVLALSRDSLARPPREIRRRGDARNADAASLAA